MHNEYPCQTVSTFSDFSSRGLLNEVNSKHIVTFDLRESSTG